MDERSTRHSLGGAVKLVAVTREQNTYVQAMQSPLLLLAIKIWRAKKKLFTTKKGNGMKASTIKDIFR